MLKKRTMTPGEFQNNLLKIKQTPIQETVACNLKEKMNTILS